MRNWMSDREKHWSYSYSKTSFASVLSLGWAIYQVLS